jgi:E3 ubiquitin-protein ligase HERC3
LTDASRVRCWGLNYSGQLGEGNAENRGDGPGDMPPSNIQVGSGTVTGVYAGGSTSCARIQATALRCWGANGFGQLGVGNMEPVGDEFAEFPSNAIIGVLEIADVNFYHSPCAAFADGSLRCWGFNGQGQLGLGHTTILGDGPNEMPPPFVDTGGEVSSLQVGSTSRSRCVVLADDSIRCWGSGQHGSLGTGNEVNVGTGPNQMPPAPLQLF